MQSLLRFVTNIMEPNWSVPKMYAILQWAMHFKM